MSQVYLAPGETAWFVWVALTTLRALGMVLAWGAVMRNFSVREIPGPLGAHEWGTNNEHSLQSSSPFFNYEKQYFCKLL